MRRLLLLVPLALVLAGCYPGQVFAPEQNADNLGGARFSQSQAVEGFDTSSYTLTDEQVESFRALLVAHDVDPGDYRAPDTGDCAGGTVTRVQMWFHGNGDTEMILDDCGAEAGSFEQLATGFFSAIHDGHTNAAIVSVAVSQDDLEFTQTDPVEVAKFVSALDRHRIFLANSMWITFGRSGDPCSGADTYSFTANYVDGSTVGPIEINGCDQRGTFEDDATTLFSKWRGALT